jgi:hypothetical protein
MTYLLWLGPLWLNPLFSSAEFHPRLLWLYPLLHLQTPVLSRHSLQGRAPGPRPGNDVINPWHPPLIPAVRRLRRGGLQLPLPDADGRPSICRPA